MLRMTNSTNVVHPVAMSVSSVRGFRPTTQAAAVALLNLDESSNSISRCCATEARRMSLLRTVNGGKCSFLGVYDSHDGGAAASFLQQNLHPAFLSHNQALVHSERAFSDAFADCNKGFAPAMPECQGGAAAVAAFFSENVMSIASVGGMGALYGNGNDTSTVEEQHVMKLIAPSPSKTTNTKILWTTDSLLQLGGKRCGFDHQELSTDEFIKTLPIGYSKLGHAICSTPAVTEIRLDSSAGFLVLASVNLWDVLSFREVGNSVRKYVVRQRKSVYPVMDKLTEGAAACLTNLALRRGSAGSLCVVVVFFSSFDIFTGSLHLSPTTHNHQRSNARLRLMQQASRARTAATANARKKSLSNHTGGCQNKTCRTATKDVCSALPAKKCSTQPSKKVAQVAARLRKMAARTVERR
eukprot:Lankesteria_metandrocarpae@DN2829_c0_g1_i1.p2